MTNTKVARDQIGVLNGRLKLFSEIGQDWVEITMPILTVNEANGGQKKVIKTSNGKVSYKSEHWTEKQRRHKLQKGTVALLLRPISKNLTMPVKIKLTRYAPRKLDRFDNLPMSMKYILDSICEIITNDYTPGRADSHEGLIVEYDQVSASEYGVKIRIDNIK